MSISRSVAVAVTAFGTVAAGLVSGATAGSAHASTSSGPTVHVFVKRDHTVVMPTVIRPGVRTFVVRSAGPAGFQVVQAAPGYSKFAAARDTNAAFTRNNMKALTRFEAHVTLFGGAASAPQRTTTMSTRLRPGTYWVLDTASTKLNAANILTIHVSGTPVGGALAGHVIRAIDEATWSRRLSWRIPTHGEIWFQNRSKDNHFLEVAKLAKGKTVKDFRIWVEQAKKGQQIPPPVDMRHTLDTGVISPGKSMSVGYRLPAGRYVLLCWWSDAEMGGAPHAFMGMIRGIQVG